MTYFRTQDMDPLRYLLFCYSLLTILLGTIGNGFVLHVIIRCKLQHINRINMNFIRGLALSDLVYIYARVFPVAVSNLTNSWVFGHHVCWASSMLASIAAIANVNFIAAVTVHRLMILSFPLKSFHFMIKYTRPLCYLVWLYASILGMRSIFVKTTAIYVPQISTCIINYAYSGTENIIFSVLFLITPFSLIIISNLILIWKTFAYSRSIRGNTAIRITKNGMKIMLKKRQRQATLTVGSLSLLLVISWLPGFIKRLGGLQKTHPGLSKATIYLFFLNCFGNPILYTLCSRDFKSEVQKKIKSCFIIGQKLTTKGSLNNMPTTRKNS